MNAILKFYLNINLIKIIGQYNIPIKNIVINNKVKILTDIEIMCSMSSVKYRVNTARICRIEYSDLQKSLDKSHLEKLKEN
jgi:hypothetical protein